MTKLMGGWEAVVMVTSGSKSTLKEIYCSLFRAMPSYIHQMLYKTDITFLNPILSRKPETSLIQIPVMFFKENHEGCIFKNPKFHIDLNN